MGKFIGAAGCLGIAVITTVGILFTFIIGMGPVFSTNQSEEATPTTQFRCGPDGGLDNVPQHLRDAVIEAANTSGIPPSIIAGQVDAESGWNENVESSANAKGPSQFIDGTWAQYGNGGNVWDGRDSIPAQGRFMKDLMDMMEPIASNRDEQIDLALAAYNAGPGNVIPLGRIPQNGETEIYVPRVREYAQTRYSADCKPTKEASLVNQVEPNANGWTRPAAENVTSRYGPRRVIQTPAGPTAPFHYGIDFPTPCGGQISAINDGTVTQVTSDHAGGWYVDIDHGGGITARYKHSEANGFHVSPGQHVSSGQHIADSGRSGYATGCHLHFEIHVNGDHTDPTTFLDSVGVNL